MLPIITATLETISDCYLREHVTWLNFGTINNTITDSKVVTIPPRRMKNTIERVQSVIPLLWGITPLANYYGGRGLTEDAMLAIRKSYTLLPRSVRDHLLELKSLVLTRGDTDTWGLEGQDPKGDLRSLSPHSRRL